MDVTLSARSVARNLLICAFSLVGIHVAIQIARLGFGHDVMLGMIRYFDLDEEFNFPSLFSFLLFFMAGGLLSVIARRAATVQDRYYAQWAGMAIIFFFLGFDEILCIHEEWSPIIRGQLHTTGPLHYAWQLPYLLVFLLLLKSYIPFFRHLTARVRGLFFQAASVYLTGVVVMESLGGWYSSVHSFPGDPIYIALSTTEETLEMVGLILFMRALIEHIGTQTPRINLNVTP